MKKVLSMDPGATRAGWAILGQDAAGYRKGAPVSYIASGVTPQPRGAKQTFQNYRMELCDHWIDKAAYLIEEYEPTTLVMEIVPSRGAEIMDQLYLVNVMATTVHVIAFEYGLEVVQVAARSVQAKIARRKPEVKLTKPQVRDGVIDRLPELADHFKGVKVFEESDALAIGLWYLGK